MFLENVNTENRIIKFGLARTVMQLSIWGATLSLFLADFRCSIHRITSLKSFSLKCSNFNLLRH